MVDKNLARVGMTWLAEQTVAMDEMVKKVEARQSKLRICQRFFKDAKLLSHRSLASWRTSEKCDVEAILGEKKHFFPGASDDSGPANILCLALWNMCGAETAHGSDILFKEGSACEVFVSQETPES